MPARSLRLMRSYKKIMKKYQLQQLGGVFETERHRSIPADPGNKDWQEYLTWIADGNTPDPAPILYTHTDEGLLDPQFLTEQLQEEELA